MQEGQMGPLFEAVLQKASLPAGASILDVGCGSGLFCQLAARQGSRVSGIDAARALLDIARERVPAGDFRAGEMEELPFEDREFDLVVGFNSFQFASSPVRALREAKRVARPGAAIAVAVFGTPQQTEAAAYLAALGSLLPYPPPGTNGPFALSFDGAIEALLAQAGLAAGRLE
jgi:ubiquinone/menaquinone biosynthesis C-methylase UbiE